MRRDLVVLMALALFVVPARAAEVADVLEDARAAYEAGDYRAAVDDYRAALDRGVDHALIHYNLGNAYFRAGELGPAIASYVRAERRAPRDERIRTNLSVARAQIRDRELGGETPAVLVPFAWTYGLLSLDEWWTLVLVAFALTAACFVTSHWRPTARGVARRVAWVAIGIGAISLVMGSVRYREEVAVTSAVVVDDQVEVRSGPGTDYGLAFRIHEGLQVDVDDRRGAWARIDLGGELVGWVPTSSLESL